MRALFAFWNRLAPLSKMLILFAMLNSLLLPFALWRVTRTEPAFAHTLHMVLWHEPEWDSWGPMSEALDLAPSSQDGKLYENLFFQKQVKFQYPPSSLVVIYPLRHEPLAGWLEGLGVPWITFIFAISWLLVAVSAFFVAQIFLASAERALLPGFDRSERGNRLVASLVWIGLTLTFYPLIKAYSLGQIQVWINALFAVLLWCWLKDRQRLGGILAGIMCLIKPHYGLLLVWGLLRRRWGFVLAGATTAVLGLLVSISLFGLGNHLDYVRVLSHLSRHGESFYPNQSINGTLNRLFFNGNNLEWEPHTFPPYHPWVYFGTLGSSLLLLAAALFLPVRGAGRGSAADLALMALTSTMASPVAWEHHYGILIPIYAFLVPCLAHTRVLGNWTMPVLACSYVLTSNDLGVVNRFANTPFNLVQSYLLAGAFCVLVLLFLVRSTRWRQARHQRAAGLIPAGRTAGTLS